MFFRLLSIETTRLVRRAMPWLFLTACVLYTGLSMQNFYTSNHAKLASGSMKMPGLSFELATSLDQSLLLVLPLLVILSANQMGNDYTQRTNQHWLMRTSRYTGLLAKFAVLAGFTFIVQVLIMISGGGVGWYFKNFTFHAFRFANVNVAAAFAAPLYMTLAVLPYLAQILLITVLARSTFAGALIGLALTQFIEILLTSFLHGRAWMMWHPHNLATSLTYLLNHIGNRVVEIPDYLAQPAPAMIALAGYTILFLAAAAWVYHRQDVGG